MSEKRLNNTIYLMHTAVKNYCKYTKQPLRVFLEMDKKYDILGYISDCPNVFDDMSDEEMVKEIQKYAS